VYHIPEGGCGVLVLPPQTAEANPKKSKTRTWKLPSEPLNKNSGKSYHLGEYNRFRCDRSEGNCLKKRN
jgi:hypothetical protein